MKKRLIVSMFVAVLAFAGYLAFTVVDSKTPVATAAKKTYSGKMYIAGMGGHFASFDLTVDPNNADNPLSIKNLDRVVIGDKKTHPTHDPRIDSNDRNTMFWSTYVLDPNKKAHMGKTDLKTGKVIKDVAFDTDPRSPGDKPPLYCSSGQTAKHYMPVFMGVEGYVDVVDKTTMEKKHRMFISDLGFKKGSYQFLHGTSSQDMKKFLVAVNETVDGKSNGKIHLVLVDLASLEKGQWKELARNTITGEPGKTITFRMYFTNDNKHIFQSVADRFWVLDANNLKLIDEKMVDGQNHDAFPTPDSKYAILTIRNEASALDADGKQLIGKTITDGLIQLYDFEAKKIVGKQVSTCQACHKGMMMGDKSAVLCGIDGNWKN